jgi:hypothetical protein
MKIGKNRTPVEKCHDEVLQTHLREVVRISESFLNYLRFEVPHSAENNVIPILQLEFPAAAKCTLDVIQVSVNFDVLKF